MELRTLNYFLMIAREENITRAAQMLHITQPTLSRQLMQLEEELGVKLFERSNHNIVLTEEGLLLKRRAQEMLSLAEKTRSELQNGQQLSGEIAIGSGEFRSFSFLSDILADFREEYPLVRLEVYSGNADNIKDQLEKGLLDVGLLSDPVDIGKYEFLRLPAKELWGFLVREDSPLAEKEFITPSDVIGQQLIVSPRTLVQNQLAGWMGSGADEMDITATFNLLYNAAMLVRKNMGIAFCLELNCKYEDLRFVPISPKMETGTVLIWKKDQNFSRAVEAFLGSAKKYAAGMADDSI